MNRKESNFGQRRSTSRTRLNQPYFKSFVKKSHDSGPRASLQSLKRSNSRTFVSRSPTSDKNRNIRDLYFKKDFLRSSVKGDTDLVKYVDLTKFSKFSSTRKVSNRSKSKSLLARQSEQTLNIKHLRKQAKILKSKRKESVERRSFRKLDDLSKQLSFARDTSKRSSVKKMQILSSRKRRVSRSPTSDYFQKRGPKSYMNSIRDMAKRDKLERKMSMKHARLSKADRIYQKNSKIHQKSHRKIQPSQASKSPQRNKIGVRTSLMKELDKKIKYIAQTINCINVRTTFSS